MDSTSLAPRPTCLRERRSLERSPLRGVFLLLLLWLAGCAAERPKPPAWKPVRPSQAALKQALRAYLGTPYRYGGTSPSGVDCSGLVLKVYEEAGIQLPRTAEKQFQAGEEVSLKELRYGDVLFFNHYCQHEPSFSFASIITDIFTKRNARPCHNGIYIGQGRFIHASPRRGVCVSNLEHETWRRSLIGARRYLPSSP